MRHTLVELEAVRRAAAAAMAEHARQVVLARAPVDNGPAVVMRIRERVGKRLRLRPLAARDARSEARRQQSLLREWRGWGLERLDGLQQARKPRHCISNVGALCKGLFEIVHAVGTIHDPTEGLLPPQRPTGGKAAVDHGPCRRELASLGTSSGHSNHRWGCHPAGRDHSTALSIAAGHTDGSATTARRRRINS